MSVINHNGEKLEFKIEKYHIRNSKNKLYDSDWLELELSIRQEKYNVDFFLVEDLERILYWMTNNNSKKKLGFVDRNLIFMKVKRNATPFFKVIYYSTEKEFTSWDLEINKTNIENFKIIIEQKIKMYPCRCGQEHYINNYKKKKI
jgi:uncharacterized membrane protein (UPF0127 family)